MCDGVYKGVDVLVSQILNIIHSITNTRKPWKYLIRECLELLQL